MRTPLPILLALVAALAAPATMPQHVAAIGPGAYPPGDCRTGTPSCGAGCCTPACPTGSAGVAVPLGIPGLTATIKGLSYDAATALVKGTLVVTNKGTAAFGGLIASVEFAPFSKDDSNGYEAIANMWCGGQKGKALAPGASRACPFALVGGADATRYDWQKATSRVAQPGVDAAALSNALAWSTSDVMQTASLPRGLKPSAVSAHATLRNTELYPQPGDKSGGFICGYALVPAAAAKAN